MNTQAKAGNGDRDPVEIIIEAYPKHDTGLGTCKCGYGTSAPTSDMGTTYSFTVTPEGSAQEVGEPLLCGGLSCPPNKDWKIDWAGLSIGQRYRLTVTGHHPDFDSGSKDGIFTY